MEMGDKDIVQPPQKMDELQKSSNKEKKRSQAKTNNEIGDTASNPNSSAKVSSVKGRSRLTYEEKMEILELLNKVTVTLRNATCKFLEGGISKTREESIKSLQSTDLDEEKIEKDIDELLISSEESLKCLEKCETGSKSPSSYSELDLGKDVEECMKRLDSCKNVEDCMKKLDHDESPSVLGKVDEFMRKIDLILKIEDCVDDPARPTESKTKGETPLIEDHDSSEETPISLMTKLQNISISAKQKLTLLEEIDRELTQETDKLTSLIDSLENSIKIGFKAQI
ncbi:hypothetical protein TNIN_50631 [Trichonephila inaurata madagascariensis]|uniref:Uncharacterized protein n=1 Tax=Trichonephila inaurata madagascariensis TaxID=2747483 RepID=A0A8X6YQ17_9ARAC|nr:hypothetical protein TNIN_50631 [Trichonephila inaurata madagascariensis]